MKIVQQTDSQLQIDSILIETSNEGGSDGEGFNNKVYRLRLRLTRPRVAITLDETQNNRLARLELLAGRVAEFLGKTYERGYHDSI